MQIDINQQAGAVSREVGDRTHQGKPARHVVVAQTYSTSAEDLWDALTSAERLPRWFMPVSGDLRLGGRFQLQGNAGGEILACQPPKLLKLTWEYGGEVSWVDVGIAALTKDSARLTLEHIAYPSEHWKNFGPGAVGIGWDLALVGLSQHLAGGMNDPKEGMAWMMSDQGKAFVRLSSDAWCRADIAGGAAEDVAKAGAERTAAAYTGA